MAMEALPRLHLRVPPSMTSSSPISRPLEFSPPIPLAHGAKSLLLRTRVGGLFSIPLQRKPRAVKCCSSRWESLKFSQFGAPENCLSDVVWPSAGAFLAMAILGKMDQMIAPTGLFLTVAPLGAVCTVLFATPAAPGAKKYNMFMAQIGCAAFGVLALYLFGPGWLARSTALAASVAFMIITRSIHPPAAGLPIMFIDGAKFHSLHFWYILFPGATGCLILCLIQELVDYLRENYKF